MTRKIDVFGCGVQKGGTTSLFGYLKQHPALSAPCRKELHVFDDETMDWRSPDYGPIDHCFAAVDDAIRFEITPIYCFWPPAIPRIKAYNPEARLIFLFRDPFDRAWSQWCMEYARGWETLPFDIAIRQGRGRLAGLAPTDPPQRIFTYLERGCYGAQVQRALANFPPAQMLFLRSEDLRERHMETLQEIARFLGIPPFPDLPVLLEHTRPRHDYPSVPTEQDKAYVADLLREDMGIFRTLTGIDAHAWPLFADR